MGWAAAWASGPAKAPAAGGRHGSRGRPDPDATAATTRSGRTMMVSSGWSMRACRPAHRWWKPRRTCAHPACEYAPGRSGSPVLDGTLTRTSRRRCQLQKSASSASGRRAVSTATRPARIVSSRTGGLSSLHTSGSGIRLPGRSAVGVRDGRMRRGGCSRAPAFSRGVAVEAMACRMRVLCTAAASAIRRMAAAQSWPPVIAQPIMTAFFTMARACGRRSVS